MRIIVLEVCAGIAAVLFLTMLVAIARHRAQSRSEGAYRATTAAEYLWSVVPWIMIAACAVPAVRLIMAGPH